MQNIRTYIKLFNLNLFSVTTERATTPRPVNPCQPDPCGRYAQCRNVGGVAACSCLPGYIGVPPNCRPECLIHSECASNLACIDEKCRDPCPGACGFNAECSVIMHNAVCRCQAGYEGDPFSGCRRITTSEYCMFTLFLELSLFVDVLLVLSLSMYVFLTPWNHLAKFCIKVQFYLLIQ